MFPIAQYAVQGVAISAGLMVIVAVLYILLSKDLPGPNNGDVSSEFYVSNETRARARIREDMDDPWRQ